jgi:hypothetical protein
MPVRGILTSAGQLVLLLDRHCTPSLCSVPAGNRVHILNAPGLRGLMQGNYWKNMKNKSEYSFNCLVDFPYASINGKRYLVLENSALRHSGDTQPIGNSLFWTQPCKPAGINQRYGCSFVHKKLHLAFSKDAASMLLGCPCLSARRKLYPSKSLVDIWKVLSFPNHPKLIKSGRLVLHSPYTSKELLARRTLFLAIPIMNELLA